MSLINKMLQDLDARGSQSGASLQPEIKPVLAAEAAIPLRLFAIGATVLGLVLAGGAWWWLKKTALPAPAPLAKQVTQPVPAAPVAPTRPVMPTQPVARAPFVAPASEGQQAAPAAPIAAAQPMARAPLAPQPRANPLPPQEPTVASTGPAPKKARAAQGARPAPAAASQQATRDAAPAAPAAGAGRSMNDAQRAERRYRDALVSLDDGRVSGAMEALAQTLQLNPRHDGARQTLVGLLIEAGRKQEAEQQLEQGLAADPGQMQMAMLLARMQIERGQSGVGTLMRSLPAAAGNADYQAFLAGALQRDGRHREALEHYALALQSNPAQGVWQMGMGISLQAEQRNADARIAFERARASGMLSAPLQEFVDRKLQQLGR
ncbi:MAG TPA: tetratricopeptide repeat protein [Telluria sp.]|jgi:MSHA biogenesis protein MshN